MCACACVCGGGVVWGVCVCEGGGGARVCVCICILCHTCMNTLVNPVPTKPIVTTYLHTGHRLSVVILQKQSIYNFYPSEL